MVRSLIGIIMLVAAVLWMPLWVQFVLFGLAILFLPYSIVCVLPALVADVLYAPTAHVTLTQFAMTGIVLAMVGIKEIIIHQTRIYHVVPTK